MSQSGRRVCDCLCLGPTCSDSSGDARFLLGLGRGSWKASLFRVGACLLQLLARCGVEGL